MANNYYGKLQISGTKKEINRFLKPLKIKEDQYHFKSFLETYLPPPKHLKEGEDHDWAMANWGTKRADDGHSIEWEWADKLDSRVVLWFRVPWGFTHHNGFKTVSKLFPELGFVLSGNTEGEEEEESEDGLKEYHGFVNGEENVFRD